MKSEAGPLRECGSSVYWKVAALKTAGLPFEAVLVFRVRGVVDDFVYMVGQQSPFRSGVQRLRWRCHSERKIESSEVAGPHKSLRARRA